MSLKDVKDLDRPEGLVRQLIFDSEELAVVDLSSEVLTVNWTTGSSAREFIGIAAALASYQDADAIVCTPNTVIEIDFGELLTLAADEELSVPSKWDLVRLDVSKTRSVAWERLSNGASVVGFGDTADCLHGSSHSEAAQQLIVLLELTGTSHIDFHSVVDNVLELAKLWHDRSADSASGPRAKLETPETTTFKDWRGYETGF
ncbi:hypothetical protein M1D89_07345 [Arthrobacter sp. D3-18]